MPITGIESLTYGVDDIAKSRRFFDDWGLKRISTGKTRLVYETVFKDQVIVRPRAAKDLPASIERGNAVRELVWGVTSKREIEAIANELSKDRAVRAAKDGTVWSTDPMGLATGFRLTRRKMKKLGRARINDPVTFERVDRASNFYKKATPIKIAHAVFYYPDCDEVEEFYIKRLGFHLSDKYPGTGTFLRCSAENEHHQIYFIGGHGKTGIHHTAFTVRDVHEVFGGGLNFSGLGWKTQFGPGRHPMASSYFWYFKCPAGGAIEYSADTDRLTRKWKPRILQRSPENLAEWALPSGILAATKKAA